MSLQDENFHIMQKGSEWRHFQIRKDDKNQGSYGREKRDAIDDVIKACNIEDREGIYMASF